MDDPPAVVRLFGHCEGDSLLFVHLIFDEEVAAGGTVAEKATREAGLCCYRYSSRETTPGQRTQEDVGVLSDWQTPPDDSPAHDTAMGFPYLPRRLYSPGYSWCSRRYVVQPTPTNDTQFCNTYATLLPLVDRW